MESLPCASTAAGADASATARGPVAGGGEPRTRPTVDGTEALLEVHLFDFEGELYGSELEVEFVARLRDEERFESAPGHGRADASRRRRGPGSTGPTGLRWQVLSSIFTWALDSSQ